VFEKFPRTGIPDWFSSIEEYDNYVNMLIRTNCIDNAKKIWWDLRVHPVYNTVEFRICDIPMKASETVALAGLFQAICAKLYKLRLQNLNFMTYSRALINENKFRASRYGLDGKLIDFGKESEVETRMLIEELLEFIDDVVPHLGSRPLIQPVYEILEKGTGADRQLATYARTGNWMDVIELIRNQFLKGI
jgi:carboxylate-amine ligase